MPSRRVHTTAGALTGAPYAWYTAQTTDELDRMVEGLGGGMGGAVGALLPDVLEPALTPNHRALAHSVIAGLGVASVRLDEWRAQCRTNADTYRAKALALPANDPGRWLYWLVELFWRLAAGFLAGLQAGYVSHLALDACTPRSVPLVA
jgi:hypothetical protein